MGEGAGKEKLNLLVKSDHEADPPESGPPDKMSAPVIMVSGIGHPSLRKKHDQREIARRYLRDKQADARKGTVQAAKGGKQDGGISD